jgi:signal transduction histidine kinase
MRGLRESEKKRPLRPKSFEREYFEALQNYLKHATEGQLGKAYELGRRGLAEGKSLVDIVAIHHDALRSPAMPAKGGNVQDGLSASATDFFAECLAPFEMARRGFHDAVKTLRQMNETLEEEIKRIAYAVHDEAGQLLVTVHLALADLGLDLPDDKKERIARIEELLKQAEGQLRRYSHELRPTILDDFGWIPAIRFLADGVAKRSHLDVRVRTEVSGRLPVATETAVYRVLQEALNNAVKHAKATRVLIDIRQKGSDMCCSVRDNGAGFVPASRTVDANTPRGLGLTAMRERMNGIGGVFSIAARRGRGTRVEIRFPVEGAYGSSHRARG